ncbi:MAG: PA14 domain-containing protein [Candidatus Doudnabacteria bacterium]
MKIKTSKQKRLSLVHWPRIKTLKKLWAFFLLVNLAFSQTLAPLTAVADSEINSSSYSTEQFYPQQILSATENSFPLKWTNQEGALISELDDTSALEKFSASNSATLIYTTTSEATTSAESNLPQTEILDPIAPEDKPASTTPDIPINTVPEITSTSAASTTESQLKIFATEEILATLPETGSSTEPTNIILSAPEETQKVTEPEIKVESPDPISAPDEIATSEPKEILPEPEKQLTSPTLEYSNFISNEKSSEATNFKTPDTARIKLSFASLPISAGQLLVEYSVASSSWQTLTSVLLTAENTNANRGGFLSAALPQTALNNLPELNIRLKILAPESAWASISASEVFFLDAIWLETDYKIISPQEEEDRLAAMQIGDLTPEEFSHLEFFSPLMDLFMPADLSSNPITLGSNKTGFNSLPLQMLPVNVSTTTPPTRLGKKVIYTDAYKSTDLEYIMSDTGLKENIILKDKKHPSRFHYLTNLDKYDSAQTSPSTITLYVKGHKGQELYKRYVMSAPIMTDSEGKESSQLTFKVNKNLITLIPNSSWLKTASYPVTVDPNVDLSILNVSSFPVAGEFWTIGFTTVGQDNLTVTPGDQATIDDMEFSSLTCDGNNVAPSISATGQISVNNWSCDGIGEIKFLDKKTGHHHMVFNFGDASQDAYNGANTWNGLAGDSNWSTGGNWSLGTAPALADDVVISTAATININSASSINSLVVGNSGGGVASVLNFNYDALSSPLSIAGNMTVYSGASITQTAGATTTVISRINISAGGNATITGSINADGKGYASNYGPGVGTADSGLPGGSSYAGLGTISANGATGSTFVYGSSTAPTDLGSAGASPWNCGATYGGAGGGAIILTVTATTTVTGSISANGNNYGACWAPPGGTGGSIYLRTGVLAGSGTVSARAGTSSSSNGGGGNSSGGRIAVYFTTDSSTATYSAYGGTGGYTPTTVSAYGGSGTLFKKSAAQTYGDLTLDNNNYGTTNELSFGKTPIASTTFDSVTVKNSASSYLATSSTATTTSFTLSNNGHYDVRAGTTLNYSSLTWSGILTDSGGTLAILNQNQDLTIPSGSKLTFNVLNGTRTYNNLTVNGTLTHSYNSTATTGSASLYKLNYTANGDLTIGASGTINVDGRGYVGGQGAGGSNTVGNYGAGGSYGGLGNNSSQASASFAYGSTTAPTDLGSAGGSTTCPGVGFAGGGAVILNVTGTTTMSGTISANGINSSNTCWYPGAGSGGTVYLTTNTISGAGTIRSNGGYGTTGSGSGGGGRVAVKYTTDNSTITLNAFGGNGINSSSNGGAGTIYKKSAAQTYGDLTLDNNNYGTTNELSFGKTPIASTTFDSVTVKNSASSYLATSSTATTTSFTLSNNGHYDVRAGTTLNYSSLTWSGILTDSGGTLAILNQNQDLTIPSGSKLTFNVLNGTRTYNNLTVNGTLTHSYNSTATTGSASLYKLNYTANGDLTIGASGTINVDGRGYVGGQGAGAGLIAANYGSGGGYGGAGGASSQVAGGIAYGSASNPTDLGSGGGNTTCPGTGATGGGAVILNVTGTTTLSGTVSANGNPGGNVCWYVGGGSGGTFNLTTNILAGAGSVTANGGAGSNNAGAGAGGRISILANTNVSTFSRSVSAGTTAGGSAASVGTTYPTDFPTLSTQTETDNNTGTSVTGNGTIISIGYYPIIQYGHVWSTWANPYIPNSNIATTSTGGTSVASKVNLGAIANAFDSNNATYWGSTEGFPYDLEYDFPTTTVVNKYIVTGYNNSADSPKDWQFQAWDGATWVNLQSVSNQTGWGAYESRAFTFVNTTPYTKYRLYISANNGGGWTRVAELEMITTGSVLVANGATTTIGSFTSAITGLTINTTYHTRSYTTTQGGTVYGNDVLFSTGPANGVPNSPSSLGPNNFTTNSWGTTTAPTLTFNLTDPDVADTVKYKIILDNDSNFASPLISYTSALGAQGSASFTVGQAAGSGSYTIGSAGQTLPDNSSYYWEVQAIDNNSGSSAFSVANSGSIAFKVDTTNPVKGTMNIAAVNPNQFYITTSGFSDAGSGISSYLFTNTTTSVTSGPIGTSDWNNSGLTPNTYYAYSVSVTDGVGLTSAIATGSAYTTANIPASPTTTVISNSSILLSWDNNSNSAATEYYAENSTSAFNSGWVTGTSTLFTGLTCGTSYTFHVKARNTSGTETAYSASVSPSASPCNNNPSAPSSLGYSQHTNGGWTNDSTPSVVFTLVDSDASDTVKYRIQFATSSDFSALVIDYTSALLTQGEKTFTVGQATSTGSYAVGFAGQTLADNLIGYYWRVMATDNSLATSAWTAAGGGAIAFKLETITPSAGSLTLTSTTTNAVSLLFDGGSDSESGLTATPYTYYNTTNWTNSGSTAATTWTNSGLIAGTYSYKVRVTDAAGNYTDVLLPSSVTVAGDGGGSGGGDPWVGGVTTGFSVYINQNDSITNTQNVTLQLTGQPGTTQMTISNLANFAGASLEPYDTTKFWDLCSGLGSCTNGTYTVYAKFYNASSQSSGSVSDTITYQILNSLTPGSLSLTSVSTSTASILISGSTDAIYGLAVNPYTFVNRTTGSQSATSSTSSWINTGLNPNTQYSYYAIVGNANSAFGNTADISAYTLANPPTSLSTTTISSTAIGLVWDNNNNPVGTEYQVLNQTTNTASGWITSTSTTISGLTCAGAYDFKVKARNANGTETAYTSLLTENTSACPSTPPTPPSGGGGGPTVPPVDILPVPALICPAPGENQFSQCFYNSMDFSSLAAIGTTGEINYDWGYTAPDPNVRADNFSARWAGNFNFSTALYQFTATSDDGVRVYVDDQLLIDQWNNHPATTYQKNISLPAGKHYVQMDFYDNFQHAVAKLSWKKITPPATPITQIPTPPAVVPQAPEIPPAPPAPIPPAVTVIPAPPAGTVTPPAPSVPPKPIPATTPVAELPKVPAAENPSPIIYVGDEIKILAETVIRSVITESKQLLLASSLPLKSFFNNFVKIKNSQNTAVGISALTLAPASLYLEYSLASHGLNINAAGSLTEIWLRILQWLYALFAAAGLRKKRRYWGTVYDSESKQPLDPAIVDLIDPQSGKVLEQNITDMHGRFGFLDRPGKFIIRSAKTNYRFPSQIILGKTDLVFDNLYHGEQLEISSDKGIITPNIPMDPMAFDWNQMDKQRVVKIHPRLEYALHIMLQTFFWSGALFVLINFLLLPNLFNSISFLVYVVMIITRRLIPHAHLWGRIIFNSGERANHLLLELHPAKIPTVVTGRAVSAETGKFFLKAMPGKYVLTIKRVDGLTNKLLYTQDVTVGKDGVVNEIIVL